MPIKQKVAFPTQRSVLKAASARRNGHVLPLPHGADPAATKIAKLLNAMLTAGLIEERPTNNANHAWRTDTQGKHTLLRIAAAGRQTIAVSAQTKTPAQTLEMSSAEAPKAAEQPRLPGGKLGQVLAAVQTEQGASLNDLVALTGWQPHTVRASLTRLRQGGVPIALTQSDGQKRYAAAADTAVSA